MKTTAVICEYNPFHRGHKLQIDGIKERGSAVISIMSGGFVQRGAPALFDKYIRAEAAVRMGADLVLEMPYPYCCSAAEFFAFGGVSIAESLGIIDELCFGSECGDIDLLNEISGRLNSDGFVRRLREARAIESNRGIAYAPLRDKVYREAYGSELLSTPNDILGIEYISALKKLGSNIIPVTYRREKGFSATSARAMIESEDFGMVPEGVDLIMMNALRYGFKYAERAVLAFYRTADPEKLKDFEGMTNGMAERLVKTALESRSLEELMSKMESKAHTNSKIRRCILHGMTGVTTSMLKEKPRYTQVLACGPMGRELLKGIKKQGDIALLTKPADYTALEEGARKQAEFNIKAEGLLTLMCREAKSAAEFIKKAPFILGEDNK